MNLKLICKQNNVFSCAEIYLSKFTVLKLTDSKKFFNLWEQKLESKKWIVDIFKQIPVQKAWSRPKHLLYISNSYQVLHDLRHFLLIFHPKTRIKCLKRNCVLGKNFIYSIEILLNMSSLFSFVKKQERSLIFFWLKKSCFLKSTLLLNFYIQWS